MIGLNLNINLNDPVRVKLTNEGCLHFVEYEENLFRGLMHEPITIEKIREKEDDNGYFTFQLWELMSIFGSKLYMGGPQFFENNLLKF